jgi:hypothetical protein
LNIERDHWQVCSQHKTTWWIGSNLFSNWQNETKEQWDSNSKLLAGYKKVKPAYPDARVSDLREASFNELQADFLAGQVTDYHELMKGCLAMLEQLLPNGDSGASGEISKIVLEEIQRRLADRKTWIFDMIRARERMEEHAEGKRQRLVQEMDGKDTPF